MEEFDWSKPEIEFEEHERWIDIDNPDLVTDEVELTEEDATDILLQDFEFDLQPRLLRKKEKRELEFYVEYDKLTNNIITITPEHKETADSIRHGIFIVKQSDLVNRVFEGKIPLNRIHIRHNKNRTKELTLDNTNTFRSEFDYVFADFNTNPGIIHIHCDIVLKRISINLDYQKFKQYLSSDHATEHKLERNNGNFNIFCVSRRDRTRLYDKFSINIFELCNIQQIERKCFWLPNDMRNFSSQIGFVYYNNDLPITYSLQSEQENLIISEDYERPQLIYKQVGSKLFVQSIMQNTNNFKINEDITFYIFSRYDPTKLIEYKRFNRSVFDNFNLYEIDLSYDYPVRLTTDHLHIHLEDSDASTYYRI